MADFKSFRGKSKKGEISLDEFGGTPDGGIAIVTDGGEMLHRTPPRVAASLRYFLAKATGRGDERFPDRLALTSALRGEGVTFLTRSIGSVLAYDSDASVVVIDLNWTSAPRDTGKGRKKGAAKLAPVAPAKETPNGDGEGEGDGDGSGEETSPDVLSLEPVLDDDDVDVGDAAAPGNRAPASKQAARRSGRGVARSTNRPAGPRAAVDSPAPIRFESPDGRPAALIDAIEERASVDDILVATTNPRLTIVHAGELPLARRPAVAASTSLQTVVDDVAKRFDHVLLDLPPVLASSDAIRLAQLADAYALVVRHGVTTTRQVDSALDELSGVPPLGVILNRYATRIPMFLRRLVGA